MANVNLSTNKTGTLNDYFNFTSAKYGFKINKALLFVIRAKLYTGVYKLYLQNIFASENCGYRCY